MADAPPAALTLWHASRADVERPTIAGRTPGDNHANSGLGLFCATGPHDYIANFGDAIHALTLREDARMTTITIGELREMGDDRDGMRDRAWFDAEGRRLAQDHDVVMIAERSGYASQAIILRDDAVASSVKMTRERFAEVSRDVFDDMRAFERGEALGRVRAKGPPDASRSPPAMLRNHSQGR